jgi:signal transduction histidine kinase/ligand-binding sensor domain-containing protein
VASFAALAESAASGMTFREIGVQRGLEGRAITDVLVDRDGFVWAASREGLYRYDGYRAERFLPDATDPDAISDSDLRALYQGGDGSIWVSANTGGLNRLDPLTGRFEVFRHDPDDPGSLSYDSVYSVVEDRAGHLWVGTQFGLNRLDRVSGRFTRFRHDGDDPGSLAHDYVFDVALAGDGSVWAATVGGGLSRWRPESARFERFDLAAATGDAGHNDVFAVIESDAGYLWAGTRAGLLRIDPATGEVREAGAPGPDEELVITTLAQGADGRLWMGTLAQGVLVFDPASWSLAQANPAALGSDGQLPALPQLRIAFLGERLLVGTWGGGLFLGSRAEAAFRLIEAEEGGLQYHDVTAVYHHEAEPTLWVGTFGGGLQGYDPGSRQFLESPGGEALFTTAGILSIALTADGALFAGDTAGLWEALPPDRFQLHRAEPGRSGSLGPGYVTALLARGNELWVGTGGSGLFRTETGSGRFDAPGAGDEGAAGYPGDFITALLAPGRDMLWVGTRSNGLSVCTLAPWSCPQQLATTGAGIRLSHDHVTFLFQDSRNRIWIGTDGGGLHQAVLDDRGFVADLRQWQEREGLIRAGVLGMVEDDDGSLWILTRRGLSRMDPVGNRFVNYTERNGLAVVSFNARAAARDSERLYFGALGGLVEVAAGLPFPEQPPSPLGITHLRSAGINARDATPGRPAGRARFDYGEPVSLQFAVLDYAETLHEYEYRSAGAPDWLPLESRRDLTLFGLAPGQHEFEIRGRDRLGQWSEAARVEIEVVPPFWMTQWFRALLLILLGTLLLGAHVLRTRRLRERFVELQNLQEQREAALRETERRRQELDEAYQGLVHLTRRLESVKEEERQHIARELHDELGQNLTAAKIDLQVLKQQLTEPDFRNRLGQALANLDGMISQVRSLSLRLRPPLLEEVGLVAALEHFVADLAERSGLEIEFEAAADVANEPGAAPSVVFRVAQEAVNNAMRHAQAGRIEVSLSQRDGGLDLVVGDDGVGFDPDAARRSAATGEHLGLLGMAERVRGAGGTLEIDTTPGGGCRVRAWVPQ